MKTQGREILTISLPHELKEKISQEHAKACEKCGCKIPLSQFIQAILREFMGRGTHGKTPRP